MTDRKYVLRIVSDTLTDGSKVWNVMVGQFELLAVDKENAMQLAESIARLIDRHTISEAKVVCEGDL